MSRPKRGAERGLPLITHLDSQSIEGGDDTKISIDLRGRETSEWFRN